MRLFRRILNKFARKEDKNIKNMAKQKQDISPDLQVNLTKINDTLGNSSDIVIRKFKLGTRGMEAFILQIDGLIDQTFVAENVMKPLMMIDLSDNSAWSSSSVTSKIRESALTVGDVKETTNLNDVFTGVLSGDTALFISGSDSALIISTKGFQSRGVQEPETETVVKGPREGFTEPLTINTSLIRRKIKNPNLRFETISIGKQTQTNVCLVYLKGVCDEGVVRELKNRLSRIDTDLALGAGNIEQFIEDAAFSLFPTIGNTERPDVAAGKILEGRIAIITEGTPIVLTVPYLFIESFQSPEDYLVRLYFANLSRWLRFLAFITTIYLPAAYIALTTYHPEMIPTQLLITMAAAREGVPFPAFLEAVGMGIVFEFIREAGVRMPRPVGQAVSIVGALVIGQSAVSAGLVGAPIIIVTSLTAITVFLVPALLDVATVLRLIMTTLAAMWGLYGILLGSLITLVHMVSLRSFGVPYLSPLAPLVLKDLKDVFFRAPIWAMKTRPFSISHQNRRRQGNAKKPAPPGE